MICKDANCTGKHTSGSKSDMCPTAYAKALARTRKTYHRNIESRRARMRQRYHKDIEKSRSRLREFYQRNIQAMRERSINNYYDNRDAVLAYKAHYRTTAAYFMAQAKESKQRHETAY